MEKGTFMNIRSLVRARANVKVLLSSLIALAHVACSEPMEGESFGDDAPTFEPVDTLESNLAGDVFKTQRAAYSAIWNQSTTARTHSVNRTYDQFLADYSTNWSAGRRLLSMDTNLVDGQVRYSGVWFASTSGQYLRLGRDYDAFLAEYSTMWNQGYRLAAMTTNVVNGQVRYNGVWNPSTSGQYLRLGRNRDQFLAEYSTMWGQGYRLVAMTTYVINGQERYDGVWNPSTAGQYLRVGWSAADFAAEHTRLHNQGYRLIAMSTFVWNDGVYYAGVWNPGTYTQTAKFGLTETDLATENAAQVASGKRLLSATTHIESLAINRITQALQTSLATRSTGFTATVAHGASRARSSAGLRRTTADSPSRSSSTSARFNVASVSKTLTATAVLQLLRAKGLSVNSTFSAYLPSDWTRGANVSNITFAQLLTHTSGFRGANGNATSYADLKTMVAGGINTANKVFSYQNQNFALFRIVIPYLNGFSESGVGDKDAATSTAYINYMNTNVFSPAGISTVSMKPAASEPTLAYPFPHAGVRGVTFGDWTKTGGGAGLHLSTDDLATFLVKLRDGTLLNSGWVTSMVSSNYGWQGSNPVRHGSVSSHGGFLWSPTSATNAEINAFIFSFSDGTQLGVEVNSATTAPVFADVIAAYNAAWIPIL